MSALLRKSREQTIFWKDGTVGSTLLSPSTIKTFLEMLKGEQAHTDTLVERLIDGQQPQLPRLKVCMFSIKSNLNIDADLKIHL